MRGQTVPGTGTSLGSSAELPLASGGDDDIRGRGARRGASIARLEAGESLHPSVPAALVRPGALRAGAVRAERGGGRA